MGKNGTITKRDQWSYKKSLTKTFGSRHTDVKTCITHPVTGEVWNWYESTFLDRYVDNGATACSEWVGGYHRQGYGMMGITKLINNEVKKTMITIQRFAMARHLKRPLESNEVVVSQCKNLGCCNINHLMLGVDADRNKSAAEGRARRYTTEFLQEHKDLILLSPIKVFGEKLGLTVLEAGNLRAALRREMKRGNVV